jgi:DNA-binding protein YbaB
MTERDIQGLRAYTSELTAKFAKIRGNLSEMQRAMAEVTATAKSPDGFVKATVGARGQLTKLELDARIYRRADSGKLAATITETVQKAATEAGEKVKAVTEKYAPGMDVSSYLRGDITSRFNRFDFVNDQIEGTD